MHQRTFVTIVLGTILLATVAVGVAAAAQPQNQLPPSYRVAQFNLTYNDNVVGKLSVNTNQWTYVLNAHGLQPGTEYYIYGQKGLINQKTTNEDGVLHIQGPWPLKEKVIGTSSSAPIEFILSDGPLTRGYCLEPQLTSGCFNGMIYTVIWGTLTTSSGTPLPSQSLHIDAWDKKAGAYLRWGDYLETGADGTFKVTRAGAPSRVPAVVYDGGEYNGIPYCDTWVYCTISSKIPV